MTAAAIKSDIIQNYYYVERALLFCLWHGVCAVLGKNTVESGGDVGRVELDVKAKSKGLQLNGGEDGLEAL